MIETSVQESALYWNGHVTRSELEHDDRRHETIEGEVFHEIGIARVHARRWLDPHAHRPRPNDRDQHINVDVIIDGRLVTLSEKRSPRDAIETAVGMKRRVLRWLRELGG